MLGSDGAQAPVTAMSPSVMQWGKTRPNGLASKSMRERYFPRLVGAMRGLTPEERGAPREWANFRVSSSLSELEDGVGIGSLTS